MGQWKKKGIVWAMAGMLAAVSLAGCGSKVNQDEIVATVGGEEIPYGVANFYARMSQAQYEEFYKSMMGMSGGEIWSQEIEEGKTQEESVKEQIMEDLENLYLLRQHAEDYEIELTEEEHKAIEEAVAKFDEDNALEEKETVSGYKKYVEEYLELATIRQKMDAPMKEGVDEEVSDEEAAQKSMKYVYFRYTKTKDDGTTEDMTDEEKEELKKTAKAFAKDLQDSEEKDIDTAAADAGVEVQTAAFDSESTSPDAKLVEAADKLEEGEVTDVVESDYGLYVGKVTSLLDREATDAEKETIVNNRKQEQYDSIMEKWREETEIFVNDTVWKKVKFQDQGVSILESEAEYDGAGTGAAEE